MARDLDISLLRAFLAVVETGSVTSAARLLNRTQAAVSQQLKRLEDTLGVELFQREHKRIALGPDGERLLEQARRIVALNDEVWGMMTTPHYRGTVTLGVPCDILPIYAPPILRRFANAWPHVQVSLASGDSRLLLEQMDRGEVDLTLTTEKALSRQPGEMLRRDRLVWVGNPDADAWRQRPLPIAIGGPTCAFRPSILAALRQAGIAWRYVIEVSNHDAMTASSAAGISVSAVMSDAIPPGLRILGSETDLPELPDFAVNLYLPATGGNELAQELAHHIRSEFAARFGDVVEPRPSRASAAA